MTAMTDTKLILETLAGKTLTNAKMLLVVNNYITSATDYPEPSADIPPIDTLTNEQLAQKFLNVMMFKLKSGVKKGAEYKARAANDAAVAAASDDSIVDL